MKKVMVLVVMLTLLAGSAFALTIVGSAHDLSSNSGPGPASSNYDEICVFCHTPHAADLTVTLAPLWNRSHLGVIPATTELYNSATLESSSRPTQVRDNIIDSDAVLCLSCHDGSALGSNLTNPLNVESNAQPQFSGSPTITNNANLYDASNYLKNDHPIGMNYTTTYDSEVSSGDDGLHSQATVENDLIFYDNILWCSTCHDVHDNANVPFLMMSNAGSDLCLTCHAK